MHTDSSIRSEYYVRIRKTRDIISSVRDITLVLSVTP